jgi:hypothetical protein
LTHLQHLKQHRHGGRGAVAAGAVSGSSVGGALSAVGSLLDMSAVSAATAASFKLLFLCGVVAWMSHRWG